MVKVSIQQALQNVADHPEPADDVMLNHYTHELVARALFAIANNPDTRVRGSLARATRAQKIIMNRLVGKRRAGSHPVVDRKTEVNFVDLTKGELDG